MKLFNWAIAGFAGFFMLNASTCGRQEVAIDNIETPPEASAADKNYAGVYQPLDGRWQGAFKIYTDTLLKEREDSLLYKLSPASLRRAGLQLSGEIQVEQEYDSESPYFQRVTIRDHYPEQRKTVVSKGVNKIQNGKMWCVVKKPDETVIHEGSTEGKHTIIWQRNEKDPQKVEYFYETVESDTYEIIGWGYYQGDDLSKMPRYWFYGKYTRQEPALR